MLSDLSTVFHHAAVVRQLLGSADLMDSHLLPLLHEYQVGLAADRLLSRLLLVLTMDQQYAVMTLMI